MSIMKAVSMFDVSKGKGFISYVTNSVTKNFYYLIRGTVKETSCCSLNTVNSEGYELVDSIVSEENLEEQIVEDEEKAALKMALQELGEKEKDIIYWFYFEGKTLGQYSKEKGVSYRACIDRKKRALEKLNKILKGRN